MSTETPAHELTRNPVDGTWGFICREHGVHRAGLAEAHALNVERKHLREDHAAPEEALVLDLSAMAGRVLDSWTEPDRHCFALMGAWCALTGMAQDLALEFAKELDRRPESVHAAVVPL